MSTRIYYRGLGICVARASGSLPRDEGIVRSIKQHRPFFVTQPESAASRELRRVASYFLAGLELASPLGDESFFARLLNSVR